MSDCFKSFEDTLWKSGPYQAVKWQDRDTPEVILTRAQAHIEYRFKYNVFRGLPEFDDLNSYGVSQDESQKRLDRAIRRLVEHMGDQSADRTLFALPNQLNTATGNAAFETLALAARAIWNCLDICIYDAALVVIQNLQKYRRQHPVIKDLVEAAVLNAGSASQKLIKEYVGNEHLLPQATPLDEQSHAMYDSLLEYITVLLCRYMVTAVDGNGWSHRCIAILAKMSTKLKHIGNDPTKFASESIEGGRDLVESLIFEADLPSRKDASRLEAMCVEKTSDKSSRSDCYVDIVEGILLEVYYYYEQHRLRLYIISLIKQLLDPITRIKKTSSEDPRAFEVNSIVYSLMSDALMLLISDDRHKNISISVEAAPRIAYAGHEVLRKNCEILNDRQKPESEKPISEGNSHGQSENTNDDQKIAWVRASWTHQHKSDKSEFVSPEPNPDKVRFQHIELRDPAAYISTLLPLVLCGANTARLLIKLISCVRFFSNNCYEDEISVYKPDRYEAMITFNTGLVDSLSDNGDGRVSDTMPLSSFANIRWSSDLSEVEGTSVESPASAGKLSVYRSLLSFRSQASVKRREDEESGSVEASEHKDILGVQALENFYSKHEKQMQAWTMDERSIAVPCRFFVISTLVFFITVLTGGLVFVFAGRGDVQGVDNSNILIFLWTLAVFGITLSKSWYSKDWGWHEFMRGKMICHGVTDLVRMAKIDSQIIIMFLLRNDQKRFFTRGPFNSFFNNRSFSRNLALANTIRGVSGFEIDCPVKLSTLVACGFLVFKVGRPEGSYLVCIGGKKRTESINLGTSAKRLICKAPQVQNEGKQPSELYFTEDTLTWDSSYGLYTNTDICFG